MADAHAEFPRPANYALFPALRFLRFGRNDPTLRLHDQEMARATRTSQGPALLHARVDAEAIRVQAWGPGAEQAVADAPRFLSLTDRDVDAFQPDHGRLARLLHEHPAAARLPVVDSILEGLIPIVLQQLVTFAEAAHGWQRLVKRYGTPAPGPLPLHVFPDPAVLVRLPIHAWRQMGIGTKRAQTVVRLCQRASRLEALRDASLDEARRRLALFPGVGPWTIASYLGMCRGDADALCPGDVHLPHTIAWMLDGTERSDDQALFARMEAFRPHRWRVVKLLYHVGEMAPRRGPKRAWRPY